MKDATNYNYKRKGILIRLDEERMVSNLELGMYGLTTYFNEGLNEKLSEKIMFVKNDERKIYHLGNQDKYFMPEQSKALDFLTHESRILFSAPTSFGKTLIIKEYIFLEKPQSVVYIVPTNALAYDTELKYSSQIYAIYRSFKSFDVEKGELVIEEAYKNTLSFFDSLRRLNTSIKKYIQKIFDENITNDLSELFKLLTSEYQLKIVDAAYYHLLTKDNPSQYSFTIIDSIERILADYDIMHDMSLRNAPDEETYEQNYKALHMKLSYILDRFSTIQELIHEITQKNQKFVSSAIGRINLLLNETTDVTGSINEIIKQLILYRNFEIEGLLSDVSILTDESLATPRRRTVKETSYVDVLEEHDKDISGIQNRLEELSKYSRQQIDRIVDEILGNKPYVNISECDYLDVTMVTLIFLYGYAYNASYTVESTESTYFNRDGKVLGNYRIRRAP